MTTCSRATPSWCVKASWGRGCLPCLRFCLMLCRGQHHCQTVHRAEENTAPIDSGLRRRAIGIVYHGVSAKVNEVRYQRHIESIKSQGVIKKPDVDATSKL